MKNRLVPVCLASLNLMFGSGINAQQHSMRKATQGVFTVKQAQLGSVLFTTHCSACHGRDLRGTEGGALVAMLIDTGEESLALSVSSPRHLEL